MKNEPTWEEDCLHWMGRVLKGKYAHWCYDWDELPIDETCFEFTCCTCYRNTPEKDNVAKIKDELRQKYEEVARNYLG